MVIKTTSQTEEGVRQRRKDFQRVILLLTDIIAMDHKNTFFGGAINFTELEHKLD